MVFVCARLCVIGGCLSKYMHAFVHSFVHSLYILTYRLINIYTLTYI